MSTQSRLRTLERMAGRPAPTPPTVPLAAWSEARVELERWQREMVAAMPPEMALLATPPDIAWMEGGRPCDRPRHA